MALVNILAVLFSDRYAIHNSGVAFSLKKVMIIFRLRYIRVVCVYLLLGSKERQWLKCAPPRPAV